MIQAQRVRIKIIKVSLDVKFPCSMHIEANKEVIASSEIYEKGAFIFNCEYEISVKQRSQTPFWEAVIALKSSRGANYNSGIVRLRVSQLIAVMPSTIKVHPLSKCYDPQAQIELSVLQVTKSLNTLMASEPKLMTVYENSRSGSQIGIIKQKSQAQYIQKDSEQIKNYNASNNFNKNIERFQNETNKRYSLNEQSKQDFYENIVQKIETQHMRQKMQNQSKDIKQKTNKIRQLQKSMYRSEEQHKRLKQQLIDLEQQNNEKQNIISQLQQQILSMHIQLESVNSLLQQKQQVEQNNQEVYANFLKEIQIKHKIKEDQTVSSFNGKLQLMNLENQKLKGKIQQKQKQCLQHLSLIEQCGQKIQKLQEKLEKQTNFGLQMQNKQKQLQYLNSVMTKQRDDAQTKYRQAKKQLEGLKNLKKSYRSLQDELNIVKKKAQSSVKQSSSTLQRINAEYKKKIQLLTEELNKTSQQLKQVSDEYNNLRLVTSNLNETMETKQKKHKQISKQLTTTREKTNLLENTHNQTKSTILVLSQNCEKMKVRIQQLELIQQQTKSSNKLLEQQLSIQKQKVVKLGEDLSLLKFEVSKHQLALTMNEFERDNTHLSCRNKQEHLANSLQTQQEKNIALDTAVSQYRHKYQQNQRLMHQLRLQETKNREQVSKLTQKLHTTEKRLSKFEQQLKEKQSALANILQQKSKLLQTNKENEKRIMELTLLNMNLQQKNTKCTTEDQLTSMRLKQLENDLQIKQQKIQSFQANEFDLRKKYNNEKEKLARAENEIKIVKRELQRYINKIRTQVSHCMKLQQSQQPVETLIKHHKNSMLKLSGDVGLAAKQLEEIKVEMQQKNRLISQLQIQLQSLELQISNKDNNIECLQELLEEKEDHAASVSDEHNQLLSIHQEYIFSFNRYKIDKEEEIRGLGCQILENVTKIKQLNEHKQIHDAQMQKKIVEINMQKEINFQLENKIKIFLKEIDKYDIDMKEVYSQLQMQEQRNNKLTNQIKINVDKNQMLSVQNESLVQKISELQNQLEQSKKMIEMTNRSKQKSMKESMERAQALMNAEYQVNHLKLLNQTLERQEYINKQQILDLKQNLKNTKNQLRLTNEQMNLLKQNMNKNQNKLRQKSLSLQQLRKQYLQNQSNFKSRNQMLSKKCNQFQQKSQLLFDQFSKLKQQSQTAIQEYMGIEKKLTSDLNHIRLQNIKITSENEKLIELHNKVENQLNILKQIHGQTTKENVLLKQKNERLQREISQKEQALYVVTGKLSELQINWQNQEKKMALKMCQYEQHLQGKIQQLMTQYQHKFAEAQIKRLKAEGQIEILKEEINIRTAKIQKLQDQIEEIEDHSNKKIKIYENQMSNFSSEVSEKFENIKRQQADKERELTVMRSQKDSLQTQVANLKVEIKFIKDEIHSKNNQLRLQSDKMKIIQNKNMQLQKKMANSVGLHMEHLIEVQKDIKKQFEILAKGRMSVKPEYGEKITELQSRIIRIMQQRMQ